MALSRRGLLRSSAGALGLTSSIGFAQNAGRFRHGVASGDPLVDRVILWTRVEPAGQADVEVRWQVATDTDFSRPVASGRVITDGRRDFTVKVDATGLTPGTAYYYRFLVGEETSPVGRTRTLPEIGLEQLKMAVVSCSNLGWGYFNVYRDIATRDDLDCVLHLGDYIYEYGPGTYTSPEIEALGRAAEPAREVVALADYRMRYQQYRRDPDLQAVHAAHPMIAVWDDHEFTNDAWKHGAENHDDSEGYWDVRRAVATQVYFEWMPVRPVESDARGRLYRSFDFGGLASLIMLDSRVYGRDRQLDVVADAPRQPVPVDMRVNPPRPITDPVEIAALDPNNMPQGVVFPPDFERFRDEVLVAPGRTILGWEQEAWVRQVFTDSKAAGTPWQILGQQTLMGKMVAMDIQPLLDPDRPGMATPEQLAGISVLAENDVPLFMDMWGGGYPAARARLLNDVRDHAENVLVLAGDSHNSWSFNITDDDGKVRAVEMATPSVTSPGFEQYINADPTALAAAAVARNPELVFAETQSRGYLDVTITPDSVTGTWNYVSDVMSRVFETRVGKRLRATGQGGGSVGNLVSV